MKNNLLVILGTICCVLSIKKTQAQYDTARPVKVAVFAPLYLDDAFDGEEYKLGKINLPKNLLPGLEFYNGVMMAVDSLSKEGVAVEISIHDTKQNATSFADIFNSNEMNGTGLMIAAITTPAELKFFAEQALKRNIPLISASYPNTTGVTSNQDFVLLNSSLRTHVEGIYNHLQKNYSTSNILMIKRKGSVEDYLQTTFNDLNKKARGVSLKMNWMELTDTFTSKQILNKLDTISNNVVVVASPYENFGLRVVRNISANKSYRTTAIGMPTWDGIKELSKGDCRNVEIVYSTPFYYSNNKFASSISKIYNAKFHSRPSDMVYRGYETVYHFTKLLLKHKQNLATNLNDKEFTVFNELDIQPVKINGKIDYYENKKLFFIKKQEGNLKSVN